MEKHESQMNNRPTFNTEISEILTLFQEMQPELINLSFPALKIIEFSTKTFILCTDTSLYILEDHSEIRHLHSFSFTFSSITASSPFIYVSLLGTIFKYLWTSFELNETFEGHTSEITCLLTSKDQKFLFSAGEDFNVRQWELNDKSGKNSKVLYSHSDKINAIDCSYDGKYFVSLGYDGLIMVFDLIQAEIVKTLECNYNSKSVKISRNNLYLGCSNKNSISLWRVTNWENFQIGDNRKSINKFEFTTDEKFAIAACEDSKVSVVNVGNNCSQMYEYHKGEVNDLIITENKTIYSVANDNTLGILKLIPPEGDFLIGTDDFIVDNYVIIEKNAVFFGEFTDSDYCMQVWELENFEKFYQSTLEFKILNSYLCQEKIICLCSDKKLRIMNQQFEFSEVFDLDAKIISVDFETVALLYEENIDFFIFPYFSHKISRIYRKSEPSTLSIINKNLYTGEYSGEIFLYDYEKSTKIKTIHGHYSKILKIQHSENLKLLFTSDDMDSVLIWGLTNHTVYQKLKHPQVTSFYVSKNMRFLYICSRASRINFYSLSDFSIITQVNSQYNCINMQVSSDEKIIFVKEIDGIHAIPNPLVSEKIISIKGSDFDSLAYAKYILSLKNPSEYNSEMDVMIILPYFLNAVHFYAYYNLPNFLIKSLESNGPFYESLNGHTPLSISIERNLEECIQVILKGFSVRQNFNPRTYFCINSSLSPLTQSSHPNLHKFYRNIFQECPNLPKFCSEKAEIPAIKTADGIIIDPNLIMDPIYYEEKGKGIKFFMSLVKFQLIIGSIKSIEFLQCLLACENTKIYDCRAIQIFLQYKWDLCKKYLYAEAVFYMFYLILISIFSTYQYQGLIITAFILNCFMILHEILQLMACPPLYFVSLWNYLEIFNNLLYFLFSILYWVGYSDLTELFSIVLFLSWIRGVLFFRIFSDTRYYLNLLVNVFRDIIPFFVIFFYSTVGFSLIFQTLDSRSSDFFTYLTSTYLTILGSPSTDSYFLLEWLFFLLVTVINQIVMLNLIVSIMANTYDDVKNNQVVADSTELIQMLLEIELIMYWNRDNNQEKFLVLCDSGNDKLTKDYRYNVKKILSEVRNFKKEIKITYADFENNLQKIAESTQNSKYEMQEIKRSLNSAKH